MKFLVYLISLMLASVVTSLPVNMICVKICNMEVTPSVEFVDEWLKSTKGVHQLRTHPKDTVINGVINDGITMDDDYCEEVYSELVPVPRDTSVSVDTVRGFFNAYMKHKYVIDYLVKLNASELVRKNWAYESKALSLHKQLVALQDVLNFNVKKLAQLVNTTCDACTKNCSESATVEATLIDALEDQNQCNWPINSVMNTIASHSNRLQRTVRHLEVAASKSKNDNTVVTPTDIDVNDLCLCST